MRRITASFIILVLLFTGCSNSKDLDVSANVKSKLLVKTATRILKEAEKNISDEEKKRTDSIAKELKTSDKKKKMELAIEYASDAAIGKLAMFSNNALFVIAGKALEAYPEHPLVINNFASLLLDSGKTSDAISFFNEALKLEPEDPILLVNLANAYIQKGDFNAAEKYAKKALATVSDFGAAYQVLTTVHLKNGNSELAAETMVKSAKHTFNDLTIHHFESFLDEVNNIQPSDEYPLKETFLDELYEIAKDDFMVYKLQSDVDTPEGQIKIKPFPQMGDIKNLADFGEYLGKELSSLSSQFENAMNRNQEYINKVNEYISETEGKPGYEGIYEAKKSLKQIFAIRVMNSFYEHKLENTGYLNNEKINECLSDMDAAKEIEEKNFEKQQKVIDSRMDELDRKSDNITDPNDLAQISKEQTELCKRGLTNQSDYLNKLVEIDKMYYEEFVVLNTDFYNEVKQILEEYWLRTGGLLKYVFDEDVFNELNTEREIMVYDYLYRTLSGLIGAPITFGLNAEMAGVMDELLENVDYTEAGSVGWGETLNPEIESQPLPKFPEPGDLPTIGLHGNFLSGQFDGEKLTVSLNTNNSSHSYEKNILSGESTITSLYGVTASTEAINGGLTKIGGKFGFGSSYSVMTGEFIVKDKHGNITDYGTVDTKQVGVSAFDGGLGAGVEIKRSQKTGIAEIKRSKSYKFKFVSLTTQ